MTKSNPSTAEASADEWASSSLETTLDSIGDGVIVMNVRGVVTRINPVAQALTGFSGDEANGRPLSEVLPLISRETRAKIENPFDHMLRENVIVKIPTGALLARRDGTEIPVADCCAPLRSCDGTLHGAVLVFRDLTAEEEAADLKAKFERNLIFADRMASVGTLAAGAAHEINNPLSYVIANLELALQETRTIAGELPSERMTSLSEMLHEAHEGAGRITKIVRGLKTFSRIEEERIGVVDLIPVIDLSIQLVLRELRQRARLVKDYGIVPLVDADEARLGQAFTNLLLNAAQAFPEGNIDAHVIHVVTFTDAAGRAIVEVRDTGAGIDPALLGRIFDPFFTTKPTGVGTGLGLTISHNIVTAIGGEISVQSQVGRGTTLRVALRPSTSLESSPADRTTVDSKSSSPRPAAVLVVDDEPALGLAMRRVLSAHRVTVVTSAQEVLDILATGQEFDVVLSDLLMPGMSGMDLYGEIERLYPQMARRVAFVTGGALTSEVHAFLDRVGSPRLEKPFDSETLREMVRALTE